jgi:hypothetical protein
VPCKVEVGRFRSGIECKAVRSGGWRAARAHGRGVQGVPWRESIREVWEGIYI